MAVVVGQATEGTEDQGGSGGGGSNGGQRMGMCVLASLRHPLLLLACRPRATPPSLPTFKAHTL
jgi:hypothetical protein